MPSRNGKNASDAITEPDDFETFVRRLQRSNARTHDTTHLPRANADRRTRLRVHDRVRFDEPRDLPCEQQVGHFRFGGRAPRHHLQCAVIKARFVRSLHQQTTAHALQLVAARALAQCAARKQAHVLPTLRHFNRTGIDLGCDHHFDELLTNDRFERGSIERPVERDDAAVGRSGIGCVARLDTPRADRCRSLRRTDSRA